MCVCVWVRALVRAGVCSRTLVPTSYLRTARKGDCPRYMVLAAVYYMDIQN